MEMVPCKAVCNFRVMARAVGLCPGGGISYSFWHPQTLEKEGIPGNPLVWPDREKTFLQSQWTWFQGKFPPMIIFYFRAIRIILLFFPCQCHLCLICIVLWAAPFLCWEIALSVKGILKRISTKPFAKVRRGTAWHFSIHQGPPYRKEALWEADPPSCSSPLTSDWCIMYGQFQIKKKKTQFSLSGKEIQRGQWLVAGGGSGAVHCTGLEEKAQV